MSNLVRPFPRIAPTETSVATAKAVPSKVLFDRSMSFEDPILSELHKYWTQCSPENGFPKRRNIFPEDITFALDRIALFKVIETETGQRQFEVRLHGKSFAGLFGEARQAVLDTLRMNPVKRDRLQQTLRTAWAYGNPLRIAYWVNQHPLVSQKIEAVSLPLCDRLGSPKYLLVGVNDTLEQVSLIDASLMAAE